MIAPTRIVIAGAGGKMGCAVAAAAAEDDAFVVVAGFGRPKPNEEVPSPDLLQACDVIVDFSSASAAAHTAMRLAALSVSVPVPAMVIGATGFATAEETMIARASSKLAIVKAANFSIGFNVMETEIRRLAARLKADDWDIEVLEAHHRRKRDAPSGSALALGEAAAGGRGVSLGAVRAAPRVGSAKPRIEGEIGFASLRGGGLVGDHLVLFAADEETLTVSHSARSRSVFALGALRAARWLRGRRAGLYGMAEVLADPV